MKKRCEKTGVFLKTLKDKKCKQCEKKFTPKGIQIKFCSQQCYWDNKKGQISKKRNGKNIKCKYCGKEFYISGSRIGIKKYCSRECAKKDNWGFKPKKRKCIICGKEFVISSQIQTQKKTCSYECWKENNKRISMLNYGKKRKLKKKTEWLKYKDGKQIKRGEHGRACSDYRKKFKEKNGYLFCELCEVNINGTPRFETHHIIYASEEPKHKELHNEKNLILLCCKCHHSLHAQKNRRNNLVKERGLEKIFKRKICQKK